MAGEDAAEMPAERTPFVSLDVNTLSNVESGGPQAAQESRPTLRKDEKEFMSLCVPPRTPGDRACPT